MAVRRKPFAGLFHQPPRLAEVLEHVGADDGVERPWWDSGSNCRRRRTRRGPAGARSRRGPWRRTRCRRPSPLPQLIASPSGRRRSRYRVPGGPFRAPVPRPRAADARSRGVGSLSLFGGPGRPSVPTTARSGDLRNSDDFADPGGLRSAPPTLRLPRSSTTASALPSAPFPFDVRRCVLRSLRRGRRRRSFPDRFALEIKRELIEQVFGLAIRRQVHAVLKSSARPFSLRSLVISSEPQATASKTRMLMSFRMLRLNAILAAEYVRAISSK